MRSRDDLDHLRAVSWTRAVEIDSTRARIFFSGSSPTCYGYSATVAETDDAVTVSLFEGSVPDSPDVCIAVGVEYSMVVATQDPIGARALLDATT